ncbi:hypothetical protein V1527DRAFT_491833 [Lipomyces starkeyi]
MEGLVRRLSRSVCGLCHGTWVTPTMSIVQLKATEVNLNKLWMRFGQKSRANTCLIRTMILVWIAVIQTLLMMPTTTTAQILL